MKRVPPNPYSPYATADPTERHLFPTLFGPPTPGTLHPAGCHGLAVVPDEPVEVAPDAESLPDGLCAACTAALRGLAVPDTRPLSACEKCVQGTRNNGLCAVCRTDAHQLWTRVRTATAPHTVEKPAGAFVVRGGPLRVTPDAFCEHGDLAFATRMHGYHIGGDDHEEAIDLVLPRCYLALLIGGVLAAVDHDNTPGAHERFTESVNRTQAKVRAALEQQTADDEEDPRR
ncbi:hypothetical protein [Streptomyces sp. NPDC050988]|uniref:hypothetical protein n=1 Tax=Streptomyces sp. NPDC050988 TaxID=3365637 RepID=UPI0037BCE4E6